MKNIITLSLAFTMLCQLYSFAADIRITGCVRDDEGKPVAGAVICNGTNFTKTGPSGKYSLVADSEKSCYVFVISSSEYELPVDEYGKYNGYRLIDSTALKQRCDFTLDKLERPLSEYSVVFQADPQSMSSRAHSVTSWDWVADRLSEFAKTFDRPVYQIVLGDMVTNEIEVPGMADKFIGTFNRIGMKTMFVAGNHDHVHNAVEYRNSTEYYVRYFGPYNFAANIGGVHYIFLDSCAWGEGPKSYEVGLNEEAISFLEGDLRFVPKDTPVMICTHCPLTQSLDGKYPHLERNILNYDRFIKALNGRKVQIWYGHTHLYAQNAYSKEELDEYAPGVSGLDSHLVGRVGGAWSCSGEITMDGCPRGVVVVDVDGSDFSWHFHQLSDDYPDDFNVYVPGTFEDKMNTLFCNVYLWDEKWETPRWYENGKPAGEMKKVIDSYDACHEPMYVKLYSQWISAGRVKLKVRNEPSKPNYCNHLFSITPSEGVRSGEIRFKDRFGREMSRMVSW